MASDGSDHGVAQPGSHASRGPIGRRSRQVSFQQALDELLANSPQVREADIAVELARREYAREQAQPIPNITLQTVAE